MSGSLSMPSNLKLVQSMNPRFFRIYGRTQIKLFRHEVHNNLCLHFCFYSKERAVLVDSFVPVPI